MATKAGRVTEEERRQAMLHDRDRAALELRGVDAALRISFRAQQAAIAANKRGDDPMESFRRVLMEAAPLVADSMVMGHLTGEKRSVTTLAKESPISLANTPHGHAIQFLADRLNVSPDRLDALRRVYGSEAIRVLKNTASTITDTMQDAMPKAWQELHTQTTVRDVARQGMHVREGTKAIRQALATAGVTPNNSYTVENLFRTQIQMAYGAGRWQADQDEAVQEILWGYKYVTVGDDRVRPEHVALDGTTLPKDDPFWRSSWPPNGYSCRCSTIPIFDERKPIRPPPVAEIDGRQIVPGPDKGFRFNPGEMVDDLLPKRVSPRRTYREAPSVQEAEQWARSVALDVNYNGLSGESANQVNRALR